MLCKSACYAGVLHASCQTNPILSTPLLQSYIPLVIISNGHLCRMWSHVPSLSSISAALNYLPQESPGTIIHCESWAEYTVAGAQPGNTLPPSPRLLYDHWLWQAVVMLCSLALGQRKEGHLSFISTFRGLHLTIQMQENSQRLWSVNNPWTWPEAWRSDTSVPLKVKPRIMFH